MNKKLVAFLLSTGILVSTCGTAFANEVVVDQPVETVNTPAPPINTTEAPPVIEETKNDFPIITTENTKEELPKAEKPIDFVNNNPVNAGNYVGENTVGENNKAEKPKPEETKPEETKDEGTKDEGTKVNEMAETLKALCKNLDNKNMKVELRKNALECKEALEKLVKSIKTTSQSDNNKQMNAIKDEYTEKKNNIYDKYTKEYKQILNKLSENVSNGTVMYQEVKECYDILDKYERQMKADKDIADKELDNLFKEYETIMDKAYEGMNKATSTVSESGSKMGSSSGTSTSYSSTGNPKTGDYTTLGASIATMIAGIAGIFVSRKR